MTEPKKLKLKFSPEFREHSIIAIILTMIILPFAVYSSTKNGYPMAPSDYILFCFACFIVVHFLLVILVKIPLDAIKTWNEDGGKYRKIVIISLVTALLVYGPALYQSIVDAFHTFKK